MYVVEANDKTRCRCRETIPHLLHIQMYNFVRLEQQPQPALGETIEEGKKKESSGENKNESKGRRRMKRKEK